MQLAALAAVTVLPIAAQASGFSDNFDTINPAWVTDRYAPNGFSSQFFDGDNRLRIDISGAESSANRPAGQQSAFYNTQGRQRGASVTANWEVSGDVYISEDFLTGANLRRTDLWTRDSAVSESDSNYPIIGVIRGDASNLDNFDPNATLTTRYRVYDSDTTDGWVDLATAVTGGWHHLSILSTGSSFQYSIDGNLVYTDNTASLPGNESLQTVFVQAYNFGNANFTGQSYSAYWDNINAQAVPEPATMAALGFGALAMLRRRKKA